MIKAYTDYIFIDLGDTPGKEAPVREIELVSYDQDKYVEILVGGVRDYIKSGYIYPRAFRCPKYDAPQYDEVRKFHSKVLKELPVTTWED